MHRFLKYLTLKAFGKDLGSPLIPLRRRLGLVTMYSPFDWGISLTYKGLIKGILFEVPEGPVVPSSNSVGDYLPIFAQVTGNELSKAIFQVYLDTRAIESFLHLISKNLI